MKLTKNLKKIAPFFVFAILIIAPILASAQNFVPCDKNCGYNDLLIMINRIIKWIMLTSVPVAAGLFAWAGILYMITGVQDQKTKAKNIFKNVLIGFVCILSAWIIVTTITNALLNTEFEGVVPIEGSK
jgi:hypothetical protein